MVAVEALDRARDESQVVDPPPVELPQALAHRRARDHEPGGERGEHRPTGRAGGPARDAGRRGGPVFFAAQVGQVVAEHGARDREHRERLEQEPRRQVARQEARDQERQVADQHHRGHEQGEVSQPLAGLRTPLVGLARDRPADVPRQEQEHRVGDQHRGGGGAHRGRREGRPDGLGRVGPPAVDEMERLAGGEVGAAARDRDRELGLGPRGERGFDLVRLPAGLAQPLGDRRARDAAREGFAHERLEVGIHGGGA